MLSHGNVISATGNVSFPYAPGKFLLNEDVQEVHLSYLPLAHIFETVVMNLMLSLGGAVGFYQSTHYSLSLLTTHHSLLTAHYAPLTTHYSLLTTHYPSLTHHVASFHSLTHHVASFHQGDTLKIIEDLAALRPTVFVSVPRLYNRIYDKASSHPHPNPHPNADPKPEPTPGPNPDLNPDPNPCTQTLVVGGAKDKGAIAAALFSRALATKLANFDADGTPTHARAVGHAPTLTPTPTLTLTLTLTRHADARTVGQAGLQQGGGPARPRP
eukprot:scaffold745_cov54-Phaeocystis_antarctica.AAC.1